MGQVAQAQESNRLDHGALLQIEAEGSVQVPPDVMTVQAGVVTTGATAAEALDRNNELAARMIAAVRTSNLRVAQLQTSNLSVNPQFAEEDNRAAAGPRRIIGYVSFNTLRVELAEVAQAGDLISLLFEAGANSIGGPTFTLRNPVPAQRRAEQVALAEARAEAENYAAALNMKVSRVVRVSDRRFADRTDNSIVVTGSAIRPTPIEPDNLTLSATVNVEYVLESM
jgi:uncharacterized protein YggE